MRLKIDLGPRSYDVVIKRGALAKAGLLTNLGGKVLIVSDDAVPAKYVKTVARQCAEPHVFTVPSGEESKSVACWQAIQSKMLAEGFGRGDCVAAVGGGMVSDLAGFAAATYMRGIACCQFPTTTLAQIDAAVGGKTALNLDGRKNVVGAFHQPAIVVADPDTLSTLPWRHWANGLAEALKTALLGDADLFSLLEHDDIAENIERIIYLCLAYKQGVVERDEEDVGERRLLNFGHLLGHAIEAACGFGGLLHGECVALGMLPFIESRTLLRRTKAVMARLKLPKKLPCGTDEMLAFLGSDKNREQDHFTVARVKQPGRGYLETLSSEEIGLLAKGVFA